MEYDGYQHIQDSSDSNDTFRPFCIDIPLYKSVRNVMIAIAYDIQNLHCQQDLYIDDVALRIINKTSDSKPKDTCYLEQNSYPVYRQTWKKFQISQFTLYKLAKPKDTYITVATQMTIDRLPQLEKLVKRWQGPISAVIFIIKDVSEVTVQHQLQQVLQKYHQIDDFREFIDIHIVFEVSAAIL